MNNNEMVEEYRVWLLDRRVGALVKYMMTEYSVSLAKATEMVLLWSVAKVLSVDIAS